MRIVTAAAILWAVLTVGVVAWVLWLVRNEPISTQASALAGVVQAATAVAVVGLTIWLGFTARRTQDAADAARREGSRQAQTAQDALRIAQRQADLSETADRHARRDRQLLQAPSVRLVYGSHWFEDPDRRLTLSFGISNDSDTAAYQVRLEVRGKTDRHDAPSPHYAAAGTPSLRPAGELQLKLDMHDFWNTTFAPIGVDYPKAFTYPWLEIELTHKGLLGQSIANVYSLWVHQLTGPPALFHESLRIRPSIEEADDFYVEF